MYPLLRKGVLLVKRERGVYVMDHATGADKCHSPVTATMLALCNGTLSMEEVFSISERTFQLEPEQLQEKFRKVSDLVDPLDAPLEQPGHGYDPADFIFVPQEAPLERKFWPDAPHARLEAPTELVFTLTHRCNFQCVYCFNGSAT